MVAKIHCLVYFTCVMAACGGSRTTREIGECIRHGNTKICWEDKSYPKIAKEFSSLLNFKTFGSLTNSGYRPHSEESCGLCETYLNLKVVPLSLKINHKKYYIVNSQNYEQRISLNICNPNQQDAKCHSKMILKNDQVSSCEQKTTLMKVLAYDPENKTFMAKGFIYPSACECLIRTIPPPEYEYYDDN